MGSIFELGVGAGVGFAIGAAVGLNVEFAVGVGEGAIVGTKVGAAEMEYVEDKCIIRNTWRESKGVTYIFMCHELSQL